MKKNNSGMTLVECVVALALIVFASTLLLTSFGAAFNIINRGKTLQIVADISYSKVENGETNDGTETRDDRDYDYDSTSHSGNVIINGVTVGGTLSYVTTTASSGETVTYAEFNPTTETGG